MEGLKKCSRCGVEFPVTQINASGLCFQCQGNDNFKGVNEHLKR